MASSSKEGVDTLVKDALGVLAMTGAELAAELDVSPATVARWLSGTTPHPREIRRMHELVRQHFSQSSEAEGVLFQNRTLGIWGFDVFFQRAHGARRVYCLKNLMGYQAGINYAVQDQLKQLFADNPDLQICYSFLKDSEAAATFKNFRAEIAREFAPNIKWKELPAGHKLMQMLGEVFASPFIIEYPDERVEVLLEVPLKVLRTSDPLDRSGFTTVFIELPDTHKYRMWAKWREELARVEWESNVVQLKRVDSFSPSISVVRKLAYGLVESGDDDFDKDSFFVVAEADGQLIGSIRLTPSEKSSPLNTWAHGKSSLAKGKSVVELTRGVVHPAKRGMRIYRWMMLRAVREALKDNYEIATAAVEPEFNLKPFLHLLGFEDVGKALPYDDAPRHGTIAQPLVCYLRKSAPRWNEIEAELTKDATQRQIEIVG